METYCRQKLPSTTDWQSRMGIRWLGIHGMYAEALSKPILHASQLELLLPANETNLGD